MRKLTTLVTLTLVALLTTQLDAQEKGDTKPDSKAASPEKSTTVEAVTEKAATGKAQKSKADARLAAEKAFSKLLTGATLVGNFTIGSDEPVDPTKLLKPDRYELATVSKVKDDIWLFIYVHKGIPIPLTMKVLWAGRTPVLTLDEFTIAGMGTFSARLMFHDGLYAGTWKHGQKGGLMFGRIESQESKKRRATVPARRVPPPQQSEPEIKGGK